MTAVSIDDLLAGRAPGYTLPQAFHLDPEVYRLELERIWRRGWLFAAHTAELRHAGDRSVFDVGDGSALIVRGEDGALRAFHNVCRHRGSRLVDSAIASFDGLPGYSAATSTGVGRGVAADPYIRCPYHQWAYRLDGFSGRVRGHGPHGRFRPSGERALPARLRRSGRVGFCPLRASCPGQPARGRAPARHLRAGRTPITAGPGKGKSGLFADLSGRCGLESGVGEQPRVLALPRRPPRVHKVAL